MEQQDRESKWMDTQIVGLTAWVNSFLTKRNQKIENIETDFCDGVRLADFLELAAKKTLDGIDLLPKGKIQSINNLSICLTFMSSIGIRLLGINPGAIYDGKKKLILGMLWSTCRCPVITKISSDDDTSKKSKKSFEAQLLSWVQGRIAPYGLTASDFKHSFVNGMVFGALIHSIDSSILDMSTFNPTFPAENLNKAFHAANESLSIPKVLDTSEIVDGTFDERGVVLYTTLLFHAASAKDAAALEAKAEQSIEKEMEEQMSVEKDIDTFKANLKEIIRKIEKETHAADNKDAENERLKKLIDYFQNKGNLSDATIAALESRASILDQLSSDKDKRLLQSVTSKALVGAKDGKLVGSDDVLSDESSWFLAPVEGGAAGEMTVRHCKSNAFLSQNKSGAKAELSNKLQLGSKWKLVENKDGSLVQNTHTGDYVKLGEDGSVTLSKDDGKDALFNVQNKLEYLQKRERMRESAIIAASLVDGGNKMLRNAQSKKFVTSGDGSSPALSSTLEDNSKWGVVMGEKGAAHLCSKKNGQYLTQNANGSLSLSADKAPASSWLFCRSGNRQELNLINQGTGDFLSQDGNSLKTVSEGDAKKGAGGDGWVIRSEDGNFSTSSQDFLDSAMETVKSDNASFSSEAGAKEGFCKGGVSLRELEERRRNVKDDIANAKAKVAEEVSRREQSDRDLQNMKDYADLTALKASEARKTIDEMEKKIIELKALFDAGQSEKSKAEEARESVENELKEQMLRDIEKKREALTKHLNESEVAADKEITLRKQRDLAIRWLEAEHARLKKEIIITGKTLSGLDSLKRNLDEHLEELCAHEEEEKDSVNMDALVKELEGVSIEEQMMILDAKIQGESKALLDIMKIDDIKKDLEPGSIKSGDLFIKDKDNWNLRHCRLVGRQFKYFTKKEDDKAEGTIDLSLRCEAIRQKAQKEGKTKVWPLKVTVSTVNESGKNIESKLFLRASSKAERHSWFAAFSCITTRVNYLADVEKEGERPDTRIVDFVSTGEGAPIHELSVDYRPISESGCNALRKGILYHDNILTLSLQNAQIKDSGMALLVVALDKANYLRILRVNGNQLTSEGAGKLFAALCVQNTSLREIDISNNKIDATVVADLFNLIKANPQLAVISLSSNLLGDAGAATVAEALAKSQAHVTTLDLNHNMIGDDGAAAIAQLLTDTPHITSVNLVGNDIGDEGAAKLAEAIAAQASIQNVDLSANDLGVKGVMAFRQCLEKNRSLKSLNLSGNEKLTGTEELAGLLGVADFSLSNFCLVRGSTSKINDVIFDDGE